MSIETRSAETIFFAALDQSDEMERAAYLDQACGGDAKLRHKVEKLLAAHPDAGSFLKDPFFGRGTTVDGPTIVDGPGTRIGPYKLLQQIGEGGFGVVYMAEQLEPVRRKVALKIIKPGLDTRSVVARFEAERQALALMDHPNIAHVLDAGATETGRPYFVMDLVKGVPITEYCDKNRLDARQRLALFATVCQAVQHAHHKGVIHRDLKPANIMVTLHDGKPVPKVIDFGVSKAISQQLTEKTLFTAYGQMVGTPQYMSPEQAEMSGLDIDTRSDIYSLGVLLYELLTGKAPLEGSRLRAAGYAEMQRMICEEEPPTPSTRLSTLGEELTVIAKHRSVEPKQLRQLLRGDLDWIVMKALDKERSRRYDTASRLADDVERFLTDEAVEARPPSASYKVRKFVRRNKGPVAAAAAVALALVAGIIGTTIGLFRAEKAVALANQHLSDAQESEKRATSEAERSRRISYRFGVDAALRSWRDGDAGHAVQLLKEHLPDPDKEDLRGFEWYHVFQLCQRYLTTPTIPANSGAVAYSPDGKWMAYGDGARVKLLDRESGEEKVFSGHKERVWDIAFSPNGKLLVSFSQDVILLRNPSSTEPPLRLKSGGVMSVGFSGDSNILACGGWDHCVWLYDVESPLRDAQEGVEIVHDAPVLSVAFSSDTTMLAACDRHGNLALWKRGEQSYEKKATVPAHGGPAACVAYSPSGEVLASAGVDGIVKVWTTANGNLELLQTLTGHTGSVSDLAFSPNGKILASCGVDQTVRTWSVQTGEELDNYRGSAPVDAVAFDPADGHTLAAACRDGVRQWDISERLPPDVLTTSQREICFATFAPNGETFVSCGWDGLVRIWDPNTWLVHNTLPPQGAVYCVAISPSDGRTLVTAGAEHMIRLWDLEDLDSESPLAELNHGGLMWTVAFSPDGHQLVSGGEGASGGLVRRWDVSSKSMIDEYDGFPNVVHMAIFSPDGKRIAAGSADGTVIVWDVATHEPIFKRTGANGLWSLAFSADGESLVATAGQAIKIWNLASGQERTLEDDSSLVMHTAFVPPDGRMLMTSGYEGTIRTWNAATGELQFEFPSVGTGINFFTTSPDNRTVTLLCRDGTIRLLRAASEGDVRAMGWYED